MNDYTKYKLKKNLSAAVDKFFDILFYPTRKLYSDCEGFRNWIQSNQSKSYNKRSVNRCLSKIFKDLDHNKSGECVVYCYSLPEYTEFGVYFDRHSYNFQILLEDDKWIKRNKLEVVRYSLYDYVKEVNPDTLYTVRDYFKDNIVLVIRRSS